MHALHSVSSFHGLFTFIPTEKADSVHSCIPRKEQAQSTAFFQVFIPLFFSRDLPNWPLLLLVIVIILVSSLGDNSRVALDNVFYPY